MKIAVEITIINGLYRFCVPSDEPRMTGNTGRTQGASTLSIPAKNEMMRRDIITNYNGKIYVSYNSIFTLMSANYNSALHIIILGLKSSIKSHFESKKTSDKQTPISGFMRFFVVWGMIILSIARNYFLSTDSTDWRSARTNAKSAAAQNPFVANPPTRLSTKSTRSTLIINPTRPSVRKLSGNVISFKSVPSVAFTIANTTATISALVNPSTRTQGTI